MGVLELKVCFERARAHTMWPYAPPEGHKVAPQRPHASRCGLDTYAAHPALAQMSRHQHSVASFGTASVGLRGARFGQGPLQKFHQEEGRSQSGLRQFAICAMEPLAP